MAQAGMHVCAESFRLGVFSRLYTRIWNNDDISRGQSTFAVEMLEMREILANSGATSLVLGDELCSGTEALSATAIVSAGVEAMVRKGARFIFATHQHGVAGRLGGAGSAVKICHMGVDLLPSTRAGDGAGGGVVYTRKLVDGPGPETYGVAICKAMGMPEEFVRAAVRHMRELQGFDSEHLVATKKSRYNSSVYVGACEACKERPGDHTHHRRHQAEAPAHVKNRAHNLQVLRARCHEKLHADERLEAKGAGPG